MRRIESVYKGTLYFEQAEYSHSSSIEISPILMKMLTKVPEDKAFRGAFSKLSFAWTIFWGFIESDFFTFAVPNTIFGIVGALANEALIESPAGTPSNSSLKVVTDGHLSRHGGEWTVHTLACAAGQRIICLAAVVLFNTANLLVFDLANQRSPESAAEDRANKPWRPVPRGLVTTDQARQLLLVAVPSVAALNWALGAWQQGLLLMVHTWLYNDLGGGDEAFIRELIISVAYGLFNNGSLKIAMRNTPGFDLSGRDSSSPQALRWTAVISGVILTTMQVQDLKDVTGDRGRGRQTIVLFLGERFSRGSIAFFVCFWSLVCARFWRLGTLASVVPLAGAAVVASRVLLLRGRPEGDARTWRFWCFWHATLYLLPLASLFNA